MTREYTTHFICAPEFAGHAVVTMLHCVAGTGVAAGAQLVTLQTDEEQMTVQAPTAGYVDRYLVAMGEQVEATALLLLLEGEDEEGDRLEILSPPVLPGDDEPPPGMNEATQDYLTVSREAAQLAARLGVDLATVMPGGKYGEIEVADVEHHVRGLLRR